VSSSKKAIEKFDKMLNRHRDKKHILKFVREFNNVENNIYGYLLENSASFLLVHKMIDFALDGYQIIPSDCFDSVRHNKFDKASEKILKAEGILKAEYGIKIDVDLTNWSGMFSSIQAADLHVIVECEALKEPTFTIGQIRKVGKKSVKIANYDASGKLAKKPASVNCKDITLVHFADKYSTIFRKYTH
jgi:hypothetical protein